MPPSYVLTDEASASSSFVLSERTAPLHKSSSSLSTGSPKKSKKVLRRRSVDFVLSPGVDSTPGDAGTTDQKNLQPSSTSPTACPKASVYEYDGPTEEEQVEVWYSRDEYDIIKARNNLIIKMMKGGTFKESDEHTFRGLEHKLKDGFKRRRANKFNALNAVLEEQDTQFAKGRADPDSIAEAYRLVSLGAKETAFLLGSRDAEESYCFAGSPRQRSKKKVAHAGGSPARPRHSSLSDLLQQHHDHHHQHHHRPEDDGENDEDDDDDDADVVDDDDDSSTVNDADTVSSESTARRTSRLRSMFGAVSLKRREKVNRRTSL